MLLSVASVAVAAGDPHAEQERLRSTDMALAKRATVKLSDLAAGWKRLPAPPEDGDSKCPGFDPDLSAFTITGKARSLFSRVGGGAVLSAVEVYETRAQAVGDFRAGAKPAAAGCLRHAFEVDFARGAGGRARATWSRMVTAPSLGERSVQYRLVGTLTLNGRRLPIYMDLLAFQRGRSLGVLFSTGIYGRIRGQTILARVMASRMR